MRGKYQQKMLEIRDAFDAGASGAATIAARAAALDEMVTALWSAEVEKDQTAGGRDCGAGAGWIRAAGAVSIFGCRSAVSAGREDRREGREACDPAGEPGAVGLRDSALAATRKRSECEKFDADNVEFTLSLLDHRLLAGDTGAL